MSPVAPTGTTKLMADVTSDDIVTLSDPATGHFYTAPIVSIKREVEHGAYNIYLTHAGLPIVDGVVMYPTSGASLDVNRNQRGAWEAKHWGRHYSMAPMWQALEAGESGGIGKGFRVSDEIANVHFSVIGFPGTEIYQVP